MKKIFLLSATTVIVAFTLLVTCQSSKTSASKLFAFNFEKGKGYNYEMVWDMNQQIMGKEMKMGLTVDYSMDVTADDGRIKTIAVMYKNLKMNMDLMGKGINVDTGLPSEPLDPDEMKTNPGEAMKRLFSGIKGKTFTLKVDREGEVLEINGFDQIITAMVDSAGMEEEDKDQLTQALSMQFNDKEIKKQFAQVLYIFPVKEINVGDSWEKNFETGGMMPIQYSTTYKVTAIEGDHVTLSARTDLGSGYAGMSMKGEQTGTLIVDSRTGLVINAEFDMNMEGGTQEIPLTMKAKGRIKGTAR